MVNEIWWDCLGHQKMTHIGNGPGPGRNYGETAVFTICRSVENTQNPSSIWKKVTFFFAQLCPVVARPWFRCKRERFFGPKNSDFGSKIRFHQWPVDFAPSDLLCDFLFPRNSRFRKKKTADAPKRRWLDWIIQLFLNQSVRNFGSLQVFKPHYFILIFFFILTNISQVGDPPIMGHLTQNSNFCQK